MTYQTRTHAVICERQKAWALGQGIEFDSKGYVGRLEDNLYRPLIPAIQEALSKGRGNELTWKLRALHSSAALVVNIFQYWFDKDIAAIARACGVQGQAIRMQFEAVFPTALRTRPHLDLAFLGRRGLLTAIESKFTECYPPKMKTIKAAYLRKDLWKGLPRCYDLVDRVYQGRVVFLYLDVPQLLKHILGLSRHSHPTEFELLYLWYDVPSPEADQHREEIDRFCDWIADEVAFRQTTHQQLFERIAGIPGVDGEYTSYLKERYFSPPIPLASRAIQRTGPRIQG